MDSSAYVERLQVHQLVLDINASVRVVFGSTSVCVYTYLWVVLWVYCH